jgi:endonuclease V-like protein UPF0215 family
MRRDIYRNIRIVGVEDGAFIKNVTKKTLLVAVLMENGFIINCCMDEIIVDGLDATEKLIQMLQGWSFDAVILAGVSFGGFNLVDPYEVFMQLGKPVIVVMRKKPNNMAVKAALVKHFEDWQKRLNVFEKLGPVYKIKTKSSEPPVFVEIVGAKLSWVSKTLCNAVVLSRIPEAIRVSRLIARGLTKSSNVSRGMF